MSLLIESAGAELGYILRKRDGVWVVAAGHSSEDGTFALLQSTPLNALPQGWPGIASTVVEHVDRTRQTVLLDEACASPEFCADAHIGQRQVASLLCLPMLRGGEVSAIVYLENNLARGAFTPNGRAVLEMLSSQAIISLENAFLYESLEQKVVERTQQLQEKNRELASALARLVEVQQQMISQEKLAELGALAAGIAHEIKNPLNFVTNFAELAGELAEEIGAAVLAHGSRVEGESREHLQGLLTSFHQATSKIREHGTRATGIVNGMALHARAGAGEREFVDLNYVLNQSLILAAHGGNKDGLRIDVVCDYDPEAGMVEMVTQDISRVVVNLVSNARYSVERKHRRGVAFVPTVVVSSRSLGSSVEIRVRDNGLGIPAVERERIFLPFFTTKPSGEGTGLGLSISHDIVVRGHQGNLQVESVEGEFAEFRVVLPRRQAHRTTREALH
jgi:signal transduction histidine kinase